MDNRKPHNKTSIFICISSRIQETSIFNEVLWGIEEEGVPYSIGTLDKEKAIELSYDAAMTSPLEVGVGFGEDGYVTLHSSKLKQDKPLLRFNFKEEPHKMRALGVNAARLVKGIPFKAI
ncbi:MAG: glycerol dehydratase reactivase beta/small subunit family protein [Clostridiaceae bacterium]|nr:glycerol dehydratase reactivase beta/small subunit family protein [Clostridiaceae bacterium]